MILKALTLENFKGIREPVRIEFAPLTLLFGPNNAGKSTIVQALMYAREVLERNNCDAGRTVLGGDVVDLGGFKNLVYGHHLNRVIRMRFELDLREASTRRETDWVRDDELENNVGWFYKNAPKKLDVQSGRRLRERLVDVWVQIEIAWSSLAECPVVQGYSVGTGVDEYARIAYDTATGEASLSYFNFGIYPFGTRYTKGDSTDFQWELAKEARKWLRQEIARNGLPELEIEEKAHVGMAGEEVPKSRDRLARHVFDEIVSQIIAGDGAWGDSSVDEATGDHNPNYAVRQSLVDSAERCVKRSVRPPSEEPFVVHIDVDGYFGSRRQKVDVTETAHQGEEKEPSADSLDVGDTSHYETQLSQPASADEDEPANDLREDLDKQATSNEQPAEKKARCWNDWRFLMDHLSDGQDCERDSWIFEFFAALVEEDYIQPDISIPLRGRDSALPNWDRQVQLDPRVWIREECNEFWESPAFAQEFLMDLLTTAVLRPGRELLGVLKKALYLSPFRRLPSRVYRTEKRPEPQIWASGLGAWDLLALGSEYHLRDSVNDWLNSPVHFHTKYRVIAQRRKSLDVGGEFWKSLVAGEIQTGSEEIRQRLEGLPEDSKLEFEQIDSGLVMAPQDLGVGISQVIPVMVAALHKPADPASRVVMIEEPESNIHPAFQVVLADLFITQAKANPNALFLVETHSEHLLLRVMRRMRETFQGRQQGELAVVPSDVSVLFVERYEGRMLARRMPLNEAGELVKAWPGGFFEEGLREQLGDD